MMGKVKDFQDIWKQSQHIVPIQVQDWKNVSKDAKEKIWVLVLVYVIFPLSKL